MYSILYEMLNFGSSSSSGGSVAGINDIYKRSSAPDNWSYIISLYNGATFVIINFAHGFTLNILTAVVYYKTLACI